MKNSLERAESINFKKVFMIFFAAFAIFAIGFIAFTAVNGYANFDGLLVRLTFARLRERMFTDVLGTFRFSGYLFLLAFHALLALWVYADDKKLGSHSALWPVLTFITGLVGWLIYLIGRVDHTMKVEKENGIKSHT